MANHKITLLDQQIEKTDNISGIFSERISYDKIELDEHEWLVTTAKGLRALAESGRGLTRSELKQISGSLLRFAIRQRDADLRENKGHNNGLALTQARRARLELVEQPRLRLVERDEVTA